jgi:hypothetical protein
MNIVLFTSSPIISNLVKNILASYNVDVSTNPNGYINSDYDMIMIDSNLFSDSIMNHKKPVLLINTQLHSTLCVEIRMDGGNCISLPFTRDELISVVESLNQQIK